MMTQEGVAATAAPPAANELPMTRREAAAFLTSKGYRISYSHLGRLCSPAIAEGPESCGTWGRDAMYLPSALLAWAQKRMSPRST